jgi:hypothetical protein
MVDTTLKDVNQSLFNQGRNLAEIEKDTQFFPAFFRSVLLFQTKTAFSEAKRNKKLDENFKVETKQNLALRASIRVGGKIQERMAKALGIATTTLIEIKNSTVQQQKIAELRYKKELGKKFDQLEYEEEYLYGAENFIPGIGVLGTRNVSPAFNPQAAQQEFDFKMQETSEANDNFKNTLIETTGSVAEFAIGASAVTTSIKYTTDIFKKTGDDVAKRRGPLARAMTSATNALGRLVPGGASGTRTAGVVTSVGTGDLDFLDDTAVDDSQQRKNKLRQAEANAKARSNKFRNFLNKALKAGGKALTIAGTVGSGLTFGLGTADMIRLNAALEAKKLEVGSDTLTSDEIAEVLRSLKTVSSFGTGQYLTAEEIAGGGDVAAGFQNSILLGYDDLKKAADEAELASRQREAELLRSTGGFAGGPPNMNIQTNNSSSFTSYNQGNMNVTDGDDLTSNSN